MTKRPPRGKRRRSRQCRGKRPRNLERALERARGSRGLELSKSEWAKRAARNMLREPHEEEDPNRRRVTMGDIEADVEDRWADEVAARRAELWTIRREAEAIGNRGTSS